jgi:outer membrane lipoprotein-sorting protein
MQALMMTKSPDKSRFEYIEPAELAGMVMVTNGSTRWRYDPARNQVTKMELRETECGPFDMDYTEIIRSLLNETDLSYEGTESVNGRSAYVLNITPRDETELVQDITNTRAWVDCENWMLLGMEIYDPDGNLAVKTEYRDITFNTGIPDSEFIFEVPEDAVVVEESFEDRMPREMTLEDARVNLAFDMNTPSYLPDGCEFDHAVVFGENKVSLMYTNGSELLHISEWVGDAVDHIEPEISDPEVVSINGTDGEFGSVFGINTLQWSADDIEYSLSCTLAKEEMLRVAESVG